MTGFKSAPPDPETAIDRAMMLRDAGRYEDAATLLTAALATHSMNARLWQVLGTVHRANEHSAAAIGAFSRAAQLTPGDLKPAYGVAQSSLEAGRPASHLFAQARRLAPGEAMLLQGRAAAQMAEGQLQKAIDELGQIVDANPLWIDGLSTVSRLLWISGERAFDQHYSRAVRRVPNEMRLWQAWIDTLLHAEHFVEAREVVTQARSTIGHEPFLACVEAIIASELGEDDAARRLFAQLPISKDLVLTERYSRHLLRTGRFSEIEPLVRPWLGKVGDTRLWPYLSLAWRLANDARWDWLEGSPDLVRVVQLDLDLDGLADRLRGLHVANRDPLGQSVRGGTQTDGPLFAREEPEIRELRSKIVDAVGAYAASLNTADPAHPTLRHIRKRFRFSGSWSVRLTGQGHHSNHVHPLGWISSACYIALPHQSEMGRAPAGWLELGAPPPELGLNLEPFRRIEPKPGQLVLFPSTTWHGTAPIAGGERLTVAFDVAAIG